MGGQLLELAASLAVDGTMHDLLADFLPMKGDVLDDGTAEQRTEEDARQEENGQQSFAF